jgi:hypothetical protein
VLSDPLHSVAPGPEDWWSLDVSYRRLFGNGWIEASVGGDYQDREWNETSTFLPRFSVSWRQEFQ